MPDEYIRSLVGKGSETLKARESKEVRESTRVVLGDIPKKVVRCSLDSCLLLPGNLHP